MKRFSICFLLALLAGVVLVYIYRRTPNDESPKRNTTQPITASSPTSTSQPSPNQDSPIHKIDFANFTYTWPKSLQKWAGAKHFTLKNRKYFQRRMVENSHATLTGACLGEIKYADLTGDKTDEAIIFIGIHSGGSSIPGMVFIYTLESQPKLLWSFETGDRADGGSPDAFVENGTLIIELNGKNKYPESNLYADDETKRGDCCPTMFTRTRYKWNGKRFAMQGQPESYLINAASNTTN